MGGICDGVTDGGNDEEMAKFAITVGSREYRWGRPV